MSARAPGPAIESVEASAFTIPTEQPEQDGTLEWSKTTLLLVQARVGDSTGTGYSYTHPAAAEVVNGKLAEVVRGCDPLAAGRAWAAMCRPGSAPAAPGVLPRPQPHRAPGLRRLPGT